MPTKSRKRSRAPAATPMTAPAQPRRRSQRQQPPPVRRERSPLVDAFSSQYLFILLGLVAAVGITFLRVTQQDFVVWDDTIEVYHNPWLNPVTASHLLYLWQHPYINQYVPIASTAYALLALMGHLSSPDPSLTSTGALLSPHPFHTANLLVHLINVLLVYTILRMLVQRDLPAAAGALLFGLHPFQVESVAWVSELRGLLAACFSLVSIWLYLRYARATREEGVDWRPFYLWALIAGILALLSKPTAVSLPLILFVLDWWIVKRPWKQSAVAILPWLAGAVALLLITQQAQPVVNRLVLPLWQRPFVAGDALAFYLFKLFVPINLGTDYGRTPAYVLDHWWGYVTWVVPVLLAAVIWYFRKSAPWLVAAGLVSLCALLPDLGFLPFSFQYYSTVADRYMYLAMLGPAVAAAFLLARWHGRAVLAVAAAVLLALSGLSFVQAGYWVNSFTLLPHSIAVNPRSDVSYGNLGIALAQNGRMSEAITRFHQAIRINPDNYQAHSNLGNALFLEKKYSAAIAEYRRSIRINPDWDESRTNLGVVLMAVHRYREAADQFRIALRINPDSQNAQAGLQQAESSIKGAGP